MKVTLVNKEETKNFFNTYGRFACKCYNTDLKYADKVGKSCLESKHFSGSRTFYFVFEIEDVDRGTAEQIMRHEIGSRCNDISLDPTMMVKNMQSFRYVDVAKDGLDFTVPPKIAKHKELESIFIDCMTDIELYYKKMAQKFQELYPNSKGEEYIENINALLPRATNTTLMLGLTVEALTHFMHKRLCTRSQDLIRRVAVAMKREVLEVAPYLEAYLVPECEYLTWCPEKKSCGLRPRKVDLSKQVVTAPSMNLTTDLSHATQILIGIKDNDGYCPCMLEKNEDTKCPCKPKREENICICGLYI